MRTKLMLIVCSAALSIIIMGEVTPVEAMSEMERAIEDGKKYAGTTIKVAISTDAAMSKFADVTKNFEKATGIKVELNELGWDVYLDQATMAFASGMPEMDVYDIWSDIVNEYAPTGGLVDLTDYMAPESKEILQDAGLLFNLRYKGRIYGFPVMPSWQIIFYNKGWWADVGLSEQDVPKTIKEFEEIIKTMCRDTDGDGVIDQHGYIADWTVQFGQNAYMLYHKAFGENHFHFDANNKCIMNFDTRAAAETVRFMKRLYQGNYISKGAVSESQWGIGTKYDNEEIGMMTIFEMYSGFLSEETYKKTGYFALPGRREGTYASIIGHEYFGIPTYSKKQGAAKAYIKYTCSHEVQRNRIFWDNTAPLYIEDLHDPEVAAAAPYLDAVKKGTEGAVICDARPPLIGGQEVNELILEKIHEALLGEKTVEKTLKEAQSKANKFETIEEEMVKKYLEYF